MEKVCIDCGSKEVVERRRCKECAKEYNRQRARKRGRWYIEKICVVCKQPLKAWRRSQIAHGKCTLQVNSAELSGTNQKLAGNYHARKLVRSLGIEIPSGWVVHHLDDNTFNNLSDNLVCMSAKAHASLHRYLTQHRVIWLKNQNENSENCWNTLRAHLTTAWLETTSAKVIKISEIGQSAAEPLLTGEGSEAMHGTPKGNAAQGEEMVQTTTGQPGQ